jgi:conjugal transfer pilus assembly protein TraU
MHRELLAWGWHGRAGLCGPYFLPAMDKTAYKTQLTYPVANTAKNGGRCCQPFGRSTIVWGAGKEYPVRGEDFAFMLFRKRNCCVGY